MSNSHRAVFLDHSSLDLGDLDLSSLSACFADLQLYPHSTQAQTIERLQGAQVAISNKVPLNAEVFAACPELKLVLVAATGTNPIDLTAARLHSVSVCNCQGYGTPSVAHHTLMLLLARNTEASKARSALATGISLTCLILAILGILEWQSGSATAQILVAVCLEIILAAAFLLSNKAK